MGNLTNYKTCRHCGRTREECGGLSRRGICADCGEARVVESIRQLTNRQGPLHDKWKAGMARAAGIEPSTPVVGTATLRSSLPKSRKTA